MDWVTISCSLLAFLLYYNTLDAGFVYDDRRAIVTNPDVVSGTPLTNLLENDFWGTPLADGGTHGSYRPLCVATFRLNYEVAGLNPWSYHLLNVLLHCLATALVIRVARQIFPPNYAKSGSAVTGLIFAAHPIHTEAVAGIVGRADLGACNLFLLSFLAYTSHMHVRDIYQAETLSLGAVNKKPNHIVPNRIVPRKNDYRLSNDSDLTESPFYRLSCLGLVQQLFQCLRRLVKVGDMRGPVSLLTGSRASIGSSAKKLKCMKTGKAQKFSKKLNKWQGVLGSAGSDSVSGWREWAALSASVALAVAATLCKETGLMALPVCIMYDLLKGIQDDKLKIKNRLRSTCIAGMAFAATALTRLQLAGGVPAFAAADNPAARDPHALTRFFTFAYLPAFNFLMLVFPITLSFDWSMEAIPRINGLLDLRNVTSVAFYILFVYATWRASTLFVSKQLTVTLQYATHHQKQRHHILRRNHRNHNNNYSKPPNRYVTSSSTNQRDYNHARHRDKRIKKATAIKKVICPNAECKHFLTEDHSQSCIQSNNNNSITQQSACICVAAKIKPRFHRPAKDYSKRKSLNKISPHFAFLTALAFLTLPFVPASNIFFYVGFVVAERVLYLPSVGYCLLVGLGAARWLASGGRAWRGGLVALLLLAFSARTLRRNLDWRDEESLFRSAVHINPPKAYGNLGSVLSSQGRLGEAEMAYRRALAHRSNMADVHYNLGVLLHGEKSYDAAIKSFEKAIQLRPSMALAYVNLGASLSAVSRPGAAAAALRAAARADGARVRDRRAHAAARVSALVQLGALHAGAARWTLALAAYQEALDAMPPDGFVVGGWSRQSVYTFIGDSNFHLSRWPDAERAYRAAVAEAPGSAPAYLTYAKLLARNSSRAVEAEQWFTRALQLEPNDPNIRHYYGEFLQSQLRHREAAEQFVSAAELAAPDASRAAAAARALRDAARCDHAERWYGRAAELRPEDPEYQSNFGAILHLNGKYVQAAAAYRRALRLQPDDEITLTNLRRVRSLMHRAGDPRIHL